MIERRNRSDGTKARPGGFQDGGIATGGTMLIALRALHKVSPKHIVLAVPVAPPETVAKLSDDADEVICLATPSPFRAVGMYYADFSQTPDEEVIGLLAAQRAARAAAQRAQV